MTANRNKQADKTQTQQLLTSKNNQTNPAVNTALGQPNWLGHKGGNLLNCIQS